MVENVDRIMHYCKICKRGFVCGGALGGHMRAHAAGNANAHIDDDHEEHPLRNFMDAGKSEGKKCNYFLRATASNRFMSTCRAAAEDCDKKLLKSSSTFSPDYQRMVSPMSEVENIGTGGKDCAWITRKRLRSSTKMDKYDENGASSDEEDLANCLVMLSNGKLDPMVTMIKNSFSLANKDCDQEDKSKEVMMKGIFQCKACKKVFNSHQALGGHRASHKKVKGCFAARFHNLNDDNDKVEEEESDSVHAVLDLNHTLQDASLLSTRDDHLKKSSKMHKCSICHRVFSSGQALGGHKRCHWLTSNLPDSMPKFQYNISSQQHYEKPAILFKKPNPPLDLNQLPALLDDSSHETDPNGQYTLKFEVPTRIYLPVTSEDNDNQNHHQHVTSNMDGSLHEVETISDEEHWKRKVVKLSNLRDINLDGGSSKWLQVGIAPTKDQPHEVTLNMHVI